ncbi:MAG: type III toxin-antitoxin system ToxN/AbiQ family toxin [Culicoidibacterales bacterium]
MIEISLSFYQVSQDYCDELRKIDHKVPTKENRPFIGFVWNIKEIYYFVPLTSPKPKHNHMKNSQDFLKINGGLWGAINFNNMIPVPYTLLEDVTTRIIFQNEKNEQYKELLINQFNWCKSNQSIIFNKMEKLYNLISSGKAPDYLQNRCCNFLALENVANDFTKNMLIEKCQQNDLHNHIIIENGTSFVIKEVTEYVESDKCVAFIGGKNDSDIVLLIPEEPFNFADIKKNNDITMF